jgi:hypothetical protein
MSDMSCYNGPELRTINEIPRKAKMGFDRPQKKSHWLIEGEILTVGCERWHDKMVAKSESPKKIG